jgi:hypothetical protein
MLSALRAWDFPQRLDANARETANITLLTLAMNTLRCSGFALPSFGSSSLCCCASFAGLQSFSATGAAFQVLMAC